MSVSSEDPKSSLLQTLTDVEQAAAEREYQAQQTVRYARFTQDVVKSLKKIYGLVPSDALTPQQWNERNSVWEPVRNASGYGYTGNAEFIALSTTATSSFTLHSLLDDIRLVPQLSQHEAINAQEDIARVIFRTPLAEQVRENMLRLGLDVAVPGFRSPVRLLEEAVAAAEQPVSVTTSPASVLVPLRETIERMLADLLPRRPMQEEAGKIGDKIRSIGEQCSLQSLPSKHFERLATTATELHRKLSGAKQRSLERTELNEVFHDGLLFLFAFLSSIDPERLKTL